MLTRLLQRCAIGVPCSPPLSLKLTSARTTAEADPSSLTAIWDGLDSSENGF